MTDKDITMFRELLVTHYATSTMNMCTHQPLPNMSGDSGPPLKHTLKPDAVQRAVYTPATVPIHWREEVKKQLDRDVDLGILERVPPNEPTLWQHRMVVVRKGLEQCHPQANPPSHVPVPEGDGSLKKHVQDGDRCLSL